MYPDEDSDPTTTAQTTEGQPHVQPDPQRGEEAQIPQIEISPTDLGDRLDSDDEELRRLLADNDFDDLYGTGDLDPYTAGDLDPVQNTAILAMAAAVNTADEDVRSSHERYRKLFTSISLGTEEELSDAKVDMDVAASSILGVVRRTGDTEVLLEITRDIGAENETQGRYTIELRTTPTELSDDTGWDHRVHAVAYAVFQIENSKDRPINPNPYGAYEMELFNVDHSIYFPGAAKVTGTGRQVTVAIPATELGFDWAAMGPDHRRQGIVHEYVTLPWYIEDFTDDDLVEGLGARGRFAYAFLMSAIARLAGIWAQPKQLGLLNRLSVKNGWVVRPRTAPIRILDTLGGDTAALVRYAVGQRACPTIDWPGATILSGSLTAMAGTWNLAKAHILSGLPMGGHNPPAAFVGSSDALLFEYRTAPDTHAALFYNPDRAALNYDFDS
ncbi:hypothetical protein [Hamadaea tsunoensis]|uniref:hypothetical protein n=1 Tax=Hamadaea tsunoensis TaxID=53368 RepID=UPI000412B72B|nr:hypothetical protein [Hamadaea tsunoensis]